jgi:hypothetical protein
MQWNKFGERLVDKAEEGGRRKEIFTKLLEKSLIS